MADDLSKPDLRVRLDDGLGDDIIRLLKIDNRNRCAHDEVDSISLSFALVCANRATPLDAVL